MIRSVALILAVCLAGATCADEAAKQQSLVRCPEGAVFTTGDTWTFAGETHRLYGVQACLRGTSFTNGNGLRVDCGRASLTMSLRPRPPSALLFRGLAIDVADALRGLRRATQPGCGRRLADRSWHGPDIERLGFRRGQSGRRSCSRALPRRPGRGPEAASRPLAVSGYAGPERDHPQSDSRRGRCFWRSPARSASSSMMGGLVSSPCATASERRRIRIPSASARPERPPTNSVANRPRLPPRRRPVPVHDQSESTEGEDQDSCYDDALAWIDRETRCWVFPLPITSHAGGRRFMDRGPRPTDDVHQVRHHGRRQLPPEFDRHGRRDPGRSRILDGDTVEIAEQRIRIFGIDAPETEQLCLDAAAQRSSCGVSARNALSSLGAGQPWSCATVDLDQLWPARRALPGDRTGCRALDGCAGMGARLHPLFLRLCRRRESVSLRPARPLGRRLHSPLGLALLAPAP